jgi:hypothetical protein
MGPVEVFQNAYREGYRNGSQAGYRNVNQGWDRDRDDGRYIYSQSDDGYGSDVGYRVGYQDGMSQAREDMYRNKPFNASPRGRYDDRDHGFRREYGDKNNYKAQYTDGYRVGYESAIRHY